MPHRQAGRTNFLPPRPCHPSGHISQLWKLCYWSSQTHNQKQEGRDTQSPQQMGQRLPWSKVYTQQPQRQTWGYHYLSPWLNLDCLEPAIKFPQTQDWPPFVWTRLVGGLGGKASWGCGDRELKATRCFQCLVWPSTGCKVFSRIYCTNGEDSLCFEITKWKVAFKNCMKNLFKKR